MPRGLPDSVVYGTYKRATRGTKSKSNKDNAYYQQNADIMNRFVARLLSRFDKSKKN